MNRQVFNRTHQLASLLAVAAAAIILATGAMASPRVLFSVAGLNRDFSAAAPIQAATGGEIITVNTLDDISDFAGLHKVSDLPGSDGRVSFREAVTAANNTAGPQTIAFAIPPAMFWLLPDVGLLRLEQGPFFLNDSATTIDFSTQTTNMGNTNSSGPEIGIYGLEPSGYGSPAIFVNGNNCVIKGLGKVFQRGYAVRIVGDHNRVIGCQIEGPLHAAVSISGESAGTTASDNIVGGTGSGEGNMLIGLVIDGPASGNIVIGNPLLVGVEVRGATQFGIFARGNRIGGPTRSERNVISGAGYYGEEGFPVGAQVSVVDADDTLIEGNFIGTTADGMRAYPQTGPFGVEVRDSRGTTIRGNLIAGLRVAGRDHAAGMTFGQAVYLNATNDHIRDTVIENNAIGLAADRVTPIATRSGITVAPVRSLYHVFNTLIASNHIAGVETAGIFVSGLENGVTITGNSIHDCGALGIDLGAASLADGPTANDLGDSDSGGNGLQNFPVLQSAVTSGSTLMVQGTLDTSHSGLFAIEFFASRSCDPSGFGEGATFLGSTTVTTDGAGHATFSVALPATVAVGAKATATATRLSTGDTSEFSACVPVAQVEPPIARATATPSSGGAPLTVQFNSNASKAPTGTIVSYAWNFGDGSSSTAANPSHTYAAGTYSARLTVTDDNNGTSSDSVSIVANSVLRSTSIDLSAAVQGAAVRVTGLVALRNRDGVAAAGAVVGATWTTPGGATVALSATTDANGIATFVTTGGAGTYTLTVTGMTGIGYAFDSANSVLVRSITQSIAGRRRSVRGF